MSSTARQRFAHLESETGVASRHDRHFSLHVDLSKKRLNIGVLSRVAGHCSVDHRCDHRVSLDLARRCTTVSKVKILC